MTLMEFLRELDREDLESPDNPVLIKNIVETCSQEVQQNLDGESVAMVRGVLLTTLIASTSEVSDENAAEYTMLTKRLAGRSAVKAAKTGLKSMIDHLMGR